MAQVGKVITAGSEKGDKLEQARALAAHARVLSFSLSHTQSR